MTIRKFWQTRNWFKFRLLGFSGGFDYAVLTKKESDCFKEIERLRKVILDDWEESNKELKGKRGV